MPVYDTSWWLDRISVVYSHARHLSFQSMKAQNVHRPQFGAVKIHNTIDDYAKDGNQRWFVLYVVFTVILCGTNFLIW